MFYSQVDVPDPTPEQTNGGTICTWSFVLVNSAQAGTAILANALENAASAVVGAFHNTISIVAEVAAGTLAGTQELV